MQPRMRRGAPHHANAWRVGARSLRKARDRSRHEAAHLIVPLLSVIAAALLAILVPRETLGATGLAAVAIAAGFLLSVALTAIFGWRRVRRQMLSEFVATH